MDCLGPGPLGGALFCSGWPSGVLGGRGIRSGCSCPPWSIVGAVVGVVFRLSGCCSGRFVVVFAGHSIFCGIEEALEGMDGSVGPGVEHWWDWL